MTYYIARDTEGQQVSAGNVGALADRTRAAGAESASWSVYAVGDDGEAYMGYICGCLFVISSELQVDIDREPGG